jgi:hypothetical protein
MMLDPQRLKPRPLLTSYRHGQGRALPGSIVPVLPRTSVATSILLVL